MPSGNSPADTVVEGTGAGGPILFLCYDNPFNNSAHSICLLTMVRRVLEHGGLAGRQLHLLAFNCVPADVERYAERRDRFLLRFSGAISVTLHSRKYPKGRLYGTVYGFISSRHILGQYLQRHRITQVYAYGEGALFLLGRVLGARPGLRIIFDCRGDHISEERARHVFSPLLPLYRRFYRRLLPAVSKCFISSSCIAGLLERYGYTGKCVINTNYVDDTVFSAQPRTFNRRGPLFVYAGGGQAYQQLERMLLIFKELAATRPAARLMLVLSMLDDRMSAVINRSRIDRSRLTIHSAHSAEEVNGYLNQADFAFMLRAAHPLNHYAFPTKFAEYLAAGLPVITTPHVPDTAEIVRREQLGLLVDISLPPAGIAAEIDTYADRVPDDIGTRCAAYAQSGLSWRSNVDRITAEILDCPPK